MTKILNNEDKIFIKLIRMNGAGNTFVIHDSRENNININKEFISYLLDNKKINNLINLLKLINQKILMLR